MPTIGDRLSEKGVSWAWFSGGWTDALNGHPDPLFAEYLHTFNAQPIAVTFTNLPTGTYSVYAYGHGGPSGIQNIEFSVSASMIKYPAVRTTTGPSRLPTMWSEGGHNVRFTNVSVYAGSPLVVESRDGRWTARAGR